MLLLSRDINQAVIVGDDIHVRVIAVDGLKVLLGFKAPRQISVHREEIYKKNRNHWSTRELILTTGGK